MSPLSTVVSLYLVIGNVVQVHPEIELPSTMGSLTAVDLLARLLHRTLSLLLTHLLYFLFNNDMLFYFIF